MLCVQHYPLLMSGQMESGWVGFPSPVQGGGIELRRACCTSLSASAALANCADRSYVVVPIGHQLALLALLQLEATVIVRKTNAIPQIEVCCEQLLLA